MIPIYRAAVRLLMPRRAARHREDMVSTAAILAREARRGGRTKAIRYWLREFHELCSIAWTERPRREVLPMLLSLLQDVRYSLRLLARTPGMTFVALLTLALGIGANTAIFSIIDGVLLRPLAYPGADRLYMIQERHRQQGDRFTSTTPGNYFDVKQSVRSFESMAAYEAAQETLTGRGDPERLQGVRSIGSVLTVLGVAPQLGRIYTDEDDRIGAPRTVVIGHALWQRLFAGRSDVLGQTLVLVGVPHTVVGVMPKGFTFPDAVAEFWAAGQMPERLRSSRTESFLTILGRLGPGVTGDVARSELETVMTRLRREYPQANEDVVMDARPLRDAVVSNVSRQLWILMASVGCVLLIACANLANLLLARATGRRQEMAIRQAIGAGRARLVQQLLVESVVLAMFGGAAGAFTGRVLLKALVTWLPAGIPRIAEAAVDERVLLFTLLVSVVTGLFFGLAPAAQATQYTAASVLRDTTRTSTGRSTVRSLLVVAEVAVAVVLLAAAGLLVRSFALMQRVDPGFAEDHLLTLQVRLDGPAYEHADDRIATVNRLVERLQTMPGTVNAAASSYAPIVGRGTSAWFNVLARPVAPGTTPPSVPYRVITPEYFSVMKIPLVRGRLLTPSDSLTGTPSVVVSESIARRFWTSKADGDPLGAEIYLGAPDYRVFPHATVVGIVKDVKLAGLASDVTDAVYGLNTLIPYWRAFTFTVRTSGDPMSLAANARQVLREVDPSLAMTAVQPMTEIMAKSSAPARASMMLLALFACVAMVMAAIGVFGVMSYSVNLRMRELGIRLALGARASEVQSMVIVQGMKQALAGIAIGLCGAAWLTRSMSTLLFGVSPGDPLTLGAVAALLLATAAVACYLPSRRATRIDPVMVLRTE